MFEVVGQLFGFLAVILGFISYQMKTPKGVLLFQLATALVFSVHYVFLNAFTAVALNLLCAVSCIVYYFRDKRGSNDVWTPLIFTALIVLASVLTWEGWYSAFIMSGLAINSVSLTLGDVQKTRFCMFIKSPLCIAYNAIVFSVGGVIYECAVLISAVIAVSQSFAKKKKE